MRKLINILLFITLFIRSITCDATNPKCDHLPDAGRIDCNADNPHSQQICESRGCCWRYANDPNHGDIPFCYFPKDFVGYKVGDINHSEEKTRVVLRRQSPSGFKNDIQTVYADIIPIDNERVRIKLTDASAVRFEVPIPKINIPSSKVDIKSTLYNINVTFDGRVQISRKTTGKVIFDSHLQYLTYSDQFLQLTTTLSSKHIYGLGEHKEPFRKEVKWSRYSMFTTGSAAQSHGYSTYHLYGDHPFFMSVEDDDANSNGMFILNSNAMDIVLNPTPSLTWRTIGGIIDIFVFIGPEPQNVVQQFNNLIGTPTLPPYWSLGFHLCRWGYNNIKNVEKTVKRNVDAGIPLDVQWIDIDMMKDGNDFTYNHDTFGTLPQFIDHLHADGRKYVQMLDCGIGAGEPPGTYPPYDDGLKQDVFIKNASGQILHGKVWNKGSTVFPDFTNPKTITYWTEQIQRFHKDVSFDGIWNDMNEPANFVDGSTYGCPESSYENPQYVPGGNILRKNSLCMTAKQYAGLHYNVHSLYGFSITIASNIALKSIKKRPFVISRSTFTGQGHYGGHWSGDIDSNWEIMKWTIASTLNFNLFGTPLMGHDICGFNGNTTVPLCARWSSLGAFYPFSRNHNTIGTIDQDPAAMGPIVTAAAKNSLLLRYELLPYLYTLFHKANKKGDTVVRPLFFEFPKDKHSYTIETQFLWGDALMIIPTLDENAVKVNAYIPPGKWYDYVKSKPINSKGMYMMFESPLTAPPVILIRGGHIIPTQEAKQTTTESRKGKFSIHAALDENQYASGSVYWDDGESLDDEKLLFNGVKFVVSNGTLIGDHKHFNYMVPMILDKIFVYGLSKEPSSVTVNGHNSKFMYNSNLEKLEIHNTEIDMSKKFTVIWK